MYMKSSCCAVRLVLASLCLLSAAVLGDSVHGASLILSLDKIIDISSLSFASIGGATYDASSGNVWISDAGSDRNLVAEIDPATGLIVSSFNANAIPGLNLGPDAIALHPVTGNLFLFSVFGGEMEAGEVTQASTFVREFSSVPNASAATFNGSNELIISDEDDGRLSRVNQVTGVLETFVSLVGYTGRVSGLTYDPITGNLFAYGDATDELLELNPVTGQVLSTTDVSGFLSSSTFPTGITFNASGDKIYLGRGSNGSGPNDLIVLSRLIPEPSALALAVLGLGMGYRRRVQR